MATLALTDAFCFIDSYDFTGDSNELRLTSTAEEKDSTTFGSSGWREFTMGLKKSELMLRGFNNFADATYAPDPVSFNNLGTADRVSSFGAVQTEGERAYMLQVMQAKYETFGQLGEMFPYSLDATGSNGVGVVNGQLAVQKTSVTTTGAKGTALSLGNVSATQYLYATFHVIGTPGTTITAVVESDDNSNFTSATTQITFGPITTAGGTWGTRVAGALAETHYRLNVTDITGTFSIACVIGIQ